MTQTLALHSTRMRPALLLAALVLVGCMGAPAEEDAPAGNATAPTVTTSVPTNATTAAGGMGERLPSRMEPFVFLANHSIAFLSEGLVVAEEKVSEPFSGVTFYTSAAQPIVTAPFVSTPFGRAFETTAEFDIVMRYSASAAAVSTFPPGAGFPLAGGWFGTPERAAFFVGATDAPTSLEANKVYTATLRVALPKGGFFVREGETISLTPFLNYQSTDNTPVAWIVGGADPAGFEMPHSHFNLSAPRAIVVLEETGETGPNPSPTSESNPQPVDIPFSVPAEALYVVLEVTGAPKAGASIDIDGSIQTASGEVLAIGSSPFATEMAVIGPSALASAGRELVAHVVSGSSASGGTFSLKVTAYAP